MPACESLRLTFVLGDRISPVFREGLNELVRVGDRLFEGLAKFEGERLPLGLSREESPF